MSAQIRVLQMIDSMGIGGAEMLLYEFTSRLDPSEFKTDICFFESGSLKEDFQKINIVPVKIDWKSRVDPSLIWQMYKVIRRVKPHIVHTHLFKSDFHGRVAARLAGVPVVFSTLHSCNDWAINPFYGLGYGLTTIFADKIIAVADEVRDYAIKYSRISPERIVTIQNAVRIEKFEFMDRLGIKIREEFGISSSTLLVGIVGRLEEPKDHENFLKAASKIYRKNKDVRFLVVGSGSLRERLESLTNDLGLSKAVIFTGLRRDVPAVMSALDLFVLSSRYEGLPVVVLEAMAAKKPIVATRVSGVPGVVEDGNTGILVNPGDPGALAKACLYLLERPELRIQMGNAGYERVKRNYSMDAFIEKSIDLYRDYLVRHKVVL
jgi:glycosyltransferase involved in cell wall biosynthesis